MRRQLHQLLDGAVQAVIVLTAVVLTFGAPGSASAHEGHAALPSTGATVEGDQVLVSENARKGLGLETAAVTLQDLSRVLRVRANVELPWNGQTMVTTLAPGRVQAIFVKPGEQVQAGQELARIESLEVEALQLTMLRANEEAALAERLVEQRRTLAQSGAVAGKSLAEAETELRQKRVQLALAQRKLTALGLSAETVRQVRDSGEPISTIAVISPMDGVVMHFDVRVGQFVNTEHHLFNIVDRSTVLIVGEVLETDAWQINPGQAVRVTFPSLPGGVLTGADRARASGPRFSKAQLGGRSAGRERRRPAASGDVGPHGNYRPAGPGCDRLPNRSAGPRARPHFRSVAAGRGEVPAPGSQDWPANTRAGGGSARPVSR
jgi:membrane fusion protein, heavy metal efflux system